MEKNEPNGNELTTNDWEWLRQIIGKILILQLLLQALKMGESVKSICRLRNFLSFKYYGEG